MKTVTFCGQHSLHHSNYENIRKQLYLVLEQLIQGGAKEFLLGGNGEFDRMCSIAIKYFKHKYPKILSILVSPYPQKNYDRQLYDKNDYPNLYRIQKKYAVTRRNEYMVRNADIIVAFAAHATGEEGKMLTYARNKNKPVIMLSDSEEATLNASQVQIQP